ncbi:MAG: hypothetical protein OEX23_17140, partial [Betaproteobacteria bacterium]|nr:hypothetical protein [Betaproteobacteria bacterium]
MRKSVRFLFLTSCGLAGSLSLAATPVAVEYRHGGFGHYFVTASAQEISALDAGAQSGWTRTGEAFGVYEPGTRGTTSVCRFWSGSSFAPRSSHFYTPSAAECADLKAGTVWRYEGEAFAVTLPDGAGACGPGTL